MAHYIKTALRVLRKDLGYTSINILGLSLGLAFGFLIYIYVSTETSYDKHFPNAENIYRIGIAYDIGGNLDKFCNMARPIGPAMKDEFPEIIAQTRVAGYNGLYDHRAFFENVDKTRVKSKQVFYADSTFFDVFKKSFVSGSLTNPLANPKSVVLSESMAYKIFGSETALQKQIKLDGKIPVTVTAVFKDDNAKTHLPYDAILSWDLGARDGEENVWIGWHVYTYGLFKENFDPYAFNKKFASFKDKYMAQTLERYSAKADLILQPLSSIHLESDLTWEAYENGNYNDILIFSAVAIFLVLISTINYVNLTTARAANRAKEIGIKKVMGCRVRTLKGQFLSESIVMVLIAAVLGLIISLVLNPAYNSITEHDLTFGRILTLSNLSYYLLACLFIGFVSGLYPAYYMSALSISNVLGGRYATSGRGQWLRKALITFQFAVSIAVIAGTVLVLRQLDFIRSKDLGFDKKNVMVVQIKNNPTKSKLDGLLYKLQSHPNILSATSTENIPGIELNQTLFDVPDSIGNYNSTGGQFIEVTNDFLDVLSMKLADGRNFHKDSPKDLKSSILLNESAVEQFGWKGKAVGKKIGNGKDSLGNRILYEVIGVVRNFHVGSLHNKVQPIVIFHQDGAGSYAMLKISEKEISETISFVTQEWQAFDPDSPIDYSFMDQNYQSFYDRENKLFSILTYISVLIIIINALGLLGLLSYSVKQKRKEIGIRRVLGSNFLQQQKLLIKEYIWTMAIGIITGSAISWYLLNQWLQNFHYRISWQGWEFVLSMIMIVLVTFVVFAVILKRTLSENPAHVLRHE